MKIIHDNDGVSRIFPHYTESEKPRPWANHFSVSVHPLNDSRPDHIGGIGQRPYSALQAIEHGAAAMIAGLGALHSMLATATERGAGTDGQPLGPWPQSVADALPALPVATVVEIESLIRCMIDPITKWADQLMPAIDAMIQDTYRAHLLDHERSFVAALEQAKSTAAEAPRAPLDSGTVTEAVARARLQQDI